MTKEQWETIGGCVLFGCFIAAVIYGFVNGIAN